MIPRARLGELVTIQRGTTYKGALLGLPGPVLLGLASIARNGGFRSDSLKTYGGDSPDSLLVQPGGLYASLKDVTQAGDLLGSVARIPLGGSVGRLTQDTVRLDVISSEVDLDYLYFSLLTPQYRQYCRSLATGTTTLGLAREDFLNYEIPFPPLDEQRRIAGALGALDALIDINRTLVADLDEAFKASWLVASSSTSKTSSFGEVTQTTKGLSYKGAFLAEEGLPMINMGSFGTDGTHRLAGLKWYVESEVKEKNRLVKGDLVVVNTDLTHSRDILGRPIIVPFEHATSTHHTFQVRVPGGEAQRFWLYCALRQDSVHQRLISYATGTTVAALPLDALTSQPIPWAEDNAIEGWWNTAKPLYTSQLALLEENEALEATREELLPLLMSGRARVTKNLAA